MRVGIDSSSIDQALLTKEACRGKSVEFVEISYMNLMATIDTGQIDATVWNEDDFCTSSHPFRAVPLAGTNGLERTQDNTEAVIVVGQANRLVQQTLRSIIDFDMIRQIQQEVMDTRLTPTCLAGGSP